MNQVPIVADMNHENVIAWPYPHGSEADGMAAMAKAGIVGIIHKARQGVGFGDPLFARRRDAARAAGLLVGAYDFATHDDVGENVKDFLAFTGVDANLSYWLDFEDNTRSEMTTLQALEFLDRVDQATGRACGIYSGNRFKDNARGLTDAQRADFAKHPLWLCEYGPVAKMIDADGHPLPWQSWFLWQYTGDGVGPLPHQVDGVENGADLSTFNGTAAALRAAWLGTALAA
jgi:lysozyme